jgi:hypothetical protein
MMQIQRRIVQKAQYFTAVRRFQRGLPPPHFPEHDLPVVRIALFLLEKPAPRAADGGLLIKSAVIVSMESRGDRGRQRKNASFLPPSPTVVMVALQKQFIAGRAFRNRKSGRASSDPCPSSGRRI